MTTLINNNDTVTIYENESSVPMSNFCEGTTDGSRGHFERIFNLLGWTTDDNTHVVHIREWNENSDELIEGYDNLGIDRLPAYVPAYALRSGIVINNVAVTLTNPGALDAVVRQW